MLMANAMMMASFLQSLQDSGSLNATVINSSVNFFFSGLAGKLLFGEILSGQWWLGAMLILTGVWMVSLSSEATKNNVASVHQSTPYPKSKSN